MTWSFGFGLEEEEEEDDDFEEGGLLLLLLLKLFTVVIVDDLFVIPVLTLFSEIRCVGVAVKVEGGFVEEDADVDVDDVEVVGFLLGVADVVEEEDPLPEIQAGFIINFGRTIFPPLEEGGGSGAFFCAVKDGIGGFLLLLTTIFDVVFVFFASFSFRSKSSSMFPMERI